MFVPFERGFRVEAVYSNIFHCPLSCSVRSPSFRGKVKTVSLTERSPNQLLRPTAEKRGQLAGQFHFFCFKDLKSQQVISLSEFFLSFHISSFLAIFMGDMQNNVLVWHNVRPKKIPSKCRFKYWSKLKNRIYKKITWFDLFYGWRGHFP